MPTFGICVLFGDNHSDKCEVISPCGFDKEDVVYKYNGILLSHKKKEILPFATTWMDLENIKLSEISQTEKDKYCMISLIYGL